MSPVSNTQYLTGASRCKSKRRANRWLIALGAHFATIIAEEVLPMPGGPDSMRAFLLRSLGLPPPLGFTSTFSPLKCIRSLHSTDTAQHGPGWSCYQAEPVRHGSEEREAHQFTSQSLMVLMIPGFPMRSAILCGLCFCTHSCPPASGALALDVVDCV